MDIHYQGSYWLKDGLAQQGLWDFVQRTKDKFAQPLQLPAYATADEEAHLEKTSKYFQENIYAHRHAFHNAVDKLDEGVTNQRPIPYNENPLLYELAVFATRVLCGTDPIVYLYTATNMNYTYQACALDYLDKAYIYISDKFFSGDQILTPEEILFLVGHELGHTQCHHTTLRLGANQSYSSMEYSADRAGVIACGCWLREQYPELSPDEIGRRCVRACAATLSKLRLGVEALIGKTATSVDWDAFDYERLEAHMEDTFRNARQLPRDTGTHPSSEHRFMAASFFVESELFYQYLGLDPVQYNNLFNAKQLDHAMRQL